MKYRVNKQLKFLVPFLIGAGVFTWGIFEVAAQTFNTYEESVSIVVIPSNPKPGGRITIQLQSSLADLDNSNIVWMVNGKTIKQGKGVREVQLTLGGVGETTDIAISIETANLGTLAKNLSFSPGGVEILYEAEVYTPPFYRGKALPTPQSVITLLAITNFKTGGGSAISSKDLVFTWKKNGTVDGANSGRGKNTYRYNNGLLAGDAPTIEVLVSAAESNVSGNASFRAASVNPEIIFYEQNPLLGVILERALLNTFFLNKTEATLVAYPFFFSTKAKENNSFSYRWAINGEEIAHPGGSIATLTVRRPGERGTSAISLEIENSQRIFQLGKAGLQIEYGN